MSTSGRQLSVAFGAGCLWQALGLLHRIKVNQVGQSCLAIFAESNALFLTLPRLYPHACIRHAGNRTPIFDTSPSTLAKGTIELSTFILIALSFARQVIQQPVNNQQTFDMP